MSASNIISSVAARGEVITEVRLDEDREPAREAYRSLKVRRQPLKHRATKKPRTMPGL
jgi:hypothetical protein